MEKLKCWKKMVFIIKQNDSSYAAADLGFHRWGDNPKGGLTYYLAKICRKLYEKDENWNEGETRPYHAPTPLGLANVVEKGTKPAYNKGKFSKNHIKLKTKLSRGTSPVAILFTALNLPMTLKGIQFWPFSFIPVYEPYIWKKTLTWAPSGQNQPVKKNVLTMELNTLSLYGTLYFIQYLKTKGCKQTKLYKKMALRLLTFAWWHVNCATDKQITISAT